MAAGRRPAGGRTRDKATLPSREAILEFLREHPGKAGKREIAQAFGIKSNDKIALKRLLREMADEGLIEGRRKGIKRAGHLAPVEELEITGRDRDGELIASPTDWDDEAHGAAPIISIVAERNRKSRVPAPGIGDRVMVRIRQIEGEDGGFLHEGRVVRVLDRKPRTVIGVFEPQSGGGGVIHSVDKKDRRDLVVAPGDAGDAKRGDLVAVEVKRGTRSGPSHAIIRDIVGDMRGEKAVSLIAILTHGIPHEFPEAAIEEANAAKPAPLKGREDLRKLPLITIDPPDAKDHDDAVHAAPDTDQDNPGGFVITVAIADVAWYVRPGSPLDRSARERGNSAYFPDRVVPMLPERLSADLCSLKAGQDRPAIVAEIIVGPDGRMRRHRFARAMIKVAANLSYAQAQAAIDGRPDDMSGPLAETVLEPLWDAYAAVARARDAREPLELDIPERKLVLDKNGRVERVYVPERLDSHRLIEAFMILANVAAAEALENRHTPLLYRVHDSPSPEKLAALADFLTSIDLKLPKAGVLLPHHFNGILERVSGSEHERLVNEVVLRSQAQAEYSAENYGHFGLNLRRYAHFTSPIRRYSDLIVHRALVRAFDLGKDGLTDAEIGELDEIAAHISATERRAMAAERETVDRLTANFLADRIGAVFEGRITGVTRSGLFVRLEETGADGFIPAGTIGADYYRYDEGGQRMVGDKTGESFTLGDQVEVKLVEAVPLAGALRFEIVSEGRYVSAKAGSRRTARRGGARGRDSGRAPPGKGSKGRGTKKRR
ncbi:ribonuclease R [Microbaculum marinum]|uniref:Ribonuclease R n=1 Tax=Microbaculum marinum TaxID=1764581 RepID=A0AAW9RM98_9HYPH